MPVTLGPAPALSTLWSCHFGGHGRGEKLVWGRNEAKASPWTLIPDRKPSPISYCLGH